MSAVFEQRFSPWSFEREGLIVQLAAEIVDGQTLRIDDADMREIELPSGWRAASLGFVAHCPIERLTRVLPEVEFDAPPVAWLVTLRCDATRLRRSVATLAWAPRVEFSVALERDELVGVVELGVQLIRSAPASSSRPGRAGRVGAKLASATTKLIHVDGPPKSAGTAIETTWCSFADDPRIPTQGRKALYRLLLERDPPTLLLNLDHVELRSVLDNKGTRGVRARLRDLVFERIEAGVWTQLLVHTAGCLATDDELPFRWQRGVLERWLPILYPESSKELARAQLARDHDQLPQLLADIDAMLQARGRVAELSHALLVDVGAAEPG